MSSDPPEERKPRPGFGLRIALYLLLCLFLLQLGSAMLLPLLDPAATEEARARGDLEPFGLGTLVAVQAILAPAVVVVSILFLHFVDRRRPDSVGGGWPEPRRLSLLGAALAPLGLALGWAVVSLGLADLRIGGWAPEALEGPSWMPGLEGQVLLVVLFAVGFVAASAAQEWMLRGYVYSTIRRRTGWVHAAGLTGIFQVLLQRAADIDAAGMVNVFLFALGLGALRELTGSLWPGAVFAGLWNVVLGSVLSLPVSGLEAPRLLDVTVGGDPAWTGGSWGPEGSWSLTSFLLVALVLLAGPLAERDADAEEEEEAGR